MTIDEKVDTCRWLISRHDNLRGSTATRAALVLSADTILLTLVVFMLDKAIPNLKDSPLAAYVCVALVLGCVILLILSLLSCLSSIASIRKSSREIAGYATSDTRLYYNARDTIESFTDYDKFHGAFMSLDKGAELEYALREMWASYHLYRLRYSAIRRAMKFLVWSILPLLPPISYYFWVVIFGR